MFCSIEKETHCTEEGQAWLQKCMREIHNWVLWKEIPDKHQRLSGSVITGVAEGMTPLITMETALSCVLAGNLPAMLIWPCKREGTAKWE